MATVPNQDQDLMRYATVPSTVGAGTLTKFLIKNGIVRTRQGAERLSIGIVVVLIVLAIAAYKAFAPHIQPVQDPNDPGWPEPVASVGT